MKKFSVFIHGKNFLLRLDQEIERLGFYTTRYVEAEDSALAEFMAVELIQNDKDLNQNVTNTPENPPMLYAEEILELESFGDVNPPGGGYSFYRYDQELH